MPKRHPKEGDPKLIEQQRLERLGLYEPRKNHPPETRRIPRCGKVHNRYDYTTEQIETVECMEPKWRIRRFGGKAPSNNENFWITCTYCKRHEKELLVDERYEAAMAECLKTLPKHAYSEEDIPNPSIRCDGLDWEHTRTGQLILIPSHDAVFVDPWHFEISYRGGRDRTFLLTCQQCLRKKASFQGRGRANRERMETVPVPLTDYTKFTNPMDRLQRFEELYHEICFHGRRITSKVIADIQTVRIWWQTALLKAGEENHGSRLRILNKQLNRMWVINKMYKGICPSCREPTHEDSWIVNFEKDYAMCRSCSWGGEERVPFLRNMYPFDLALPEWS